MNPLILKGIRERLRIKHLIASALFSLIITTTLYLSTYLNGMQERRHYDFATKQSSIIEENPINGARNAFTYLLGFQGFLLMFLGTGRVASVTAEEKENGLLDYQRMTPMNPFSKINGYLFGLPAREYFMFLLTLPFLFHCVIVGEIPWLNVLHLYLVFFSSVILYHLTAHVIGLVVPRPRAASWVSRISVLGLYVFLPGLGQVGVSFLSFLTILPTYFGKILPNLLSVGETNLGRFEAKAADFWQNVPFFNFTISPSTFTFFMQGWIILTLSVTAYRKWRNDTLPAFSKSSGFILFGIFQFLLLGSLWAFFSEGKANGLLGDTFSTKEAAMFGAGKQTLILVLTIFFGLSLAAILCLVNICCPNLHLHLKGNQRSRMLNLKKIPFLADESSGFGFVSILSILTILVYSCFLTLGFNSDIWKLAAPSLQSLFLPFLLIFCTSVYLQAAREQWFNLGFWGFLGLLWITPLLTSLVLLIGWQKDFTDFILKLLSLNPISWFPMHLMIEYSDRAHLSQILSEDLLEAQWFGIYIALIFAIFLQTRLYLTRKKRKSLRL